MPKEMVPVQMAEPVTPPLGQLPKVVDPMPATFPSPVEPKNVVMPTTPIPATQPVPQLQKPLVVPDVPLPQTQPSAIELPRERKLQEQMIAMVPVKTENATNESTPILENGAPASTAIENAQKPEKQGQSDVSPVSTAAPRSDAPAKNAKAAPMLGNVQPTAAPRSDRESQPISLTDKPLSIPSRAGTVKVADGVEMKTALPVISIVTVSSSLPENPIAVLTFSADGKVSQVVLTRSTGYADWDGPVIASFYKWRATGKRLEELNHSFSITIHLILGDR